MPEISPTSSLLDVASSKNVESKRKENGSDLINEHLVSKTASSDSGVGCLKRYCTNVTNNTLTWLREWRPINKAKRATADNAFSVMGHSLLQQAEDVSIQLQARQAPPQQPSLRLKGKTGWFLGAGILTGATAGTLSFRYYSTPNATAANDFPADAPEPLALRGATAIEDMGHFEHIPPALQSANLIRESYIHHDEEHHLVSNNKHDKRTGVVGFLRKKNLLDKHVPKNELKKEVLVSAVAKYIYSDEVDGPKSQTAREIRVAMHILAEMDLYGGRKGEPISHDFAQSVISHWVFRQILGTSPGQFVADEINKSEYPSYFTLSSLKHTLDLNTLFRAGLLKYHDIPVNQWSEFNTLWHFYLEKEIPIIKWREQGIDSIPLGSQRFADLCVGAAFLNDGRYLKDFSLNETLQTGKALWDIAINERVDIDKAGYFLFPSLLALASNQQETSNTKNNVFGSNVAAVSSYIAYRKKVFAVEQALTRMFARYQSATHAWLSKGKLADEIIADCPESELAALPDIADGARTRQQMREKKERSAKQAYMNNISKPCRRAPENLDDEYKKLTHEVADAFEEIDKVFIWSALATAEKNELEFFSSPEAKINSVHFSMRANRPVALVHSVSVVTDFEVKTKNTDLFSVTVNNEERIYALKKKMNKSDSGYQLLRVDRNIRNYIDNGILDCVFSKKYEVQGNEVIDSDAFIFSIATANEPITSVSHEYNPVTAHFSQVHRAAFYHSLYETGNDKSDLQKIWSVVKHLLPFYDCIEGIANHDAAQAVPACMLDIIALIPVAGQAASMGSKFGMGLAKGLQLSGKTLVRGSAVDAGSTMLKQIRLPTMNEVLTLGKNTLSAVDPGFELLSRGNKALQKTLETYLRQRASSIPLAEKISTYHTVQKSALAPKAYITARMPHSDIEVPVKKIDGDAQNAIYALVNPDNGEIFGRHYTLSDNGRLELPETIMQQQQTRHNVLASNVAINRMDQQVFPVPAHDIFVDIAHIPPLEKFLPMPVFPPQHMPHQAPNLPDARYDMREGLIGFAREKYNQNDVFFCRFNQNVADIPLSFAQLRNHLQEYNDGISLARQYANSLGHEFSRTTMRNVDGVLQYPPRGNRIEAYLSKVLKLDEIADRNIVQVIKKEAMQRLSYHTEKIRNYLNAETENIYFASCDTDVNPYVYNPNSPMGFMSQWDSFRRIIIMVDNYQAAPILSTQLHLTALHEVSHFSGTLDFQIAPSTSLVGDASEFIEVFTDGIFGVNNEQINIPDDFINAYRHKFPHIDINENQFRELLKRDPILRANAFMENADFVARMIADLASRTPYNRDILNRRRRNAEPSHADMTVLLYRLVLGTMKNSTQGDRV